MRTALPGITLQNSAVFLPVIVNAPENLMFVDLFKRCLPRLELTVFLFTPGELLMKYITRMIKPIIAASMLTASFAALASQADLDAEKAMYVQAFNSGDLETIKAKARNLEWSGLSDEQVFDLLEKQIIANMNVSDRAGLDATAWMIRGIGSSGNQKYLATLNKVMESGSKKLQRHAKNAIEELPKFAERNPVISKGLDKSAAGRVGEQRVMNLLNSENAELKYAGIERAYDFYSKGAAADKEVMGKIQALLLAGYKSEAKDRAELNSLVLMCKTLANTRDSAYAATINEVADKAPNKKLAKHAAKMSAVFK